MKYRNTLSIKYDVDPSSQDGLYILYPRSNGQLVNVDQSTNPVIKVSVTDNIQGQNPKSWSAYINDGLIYLSASDFPYDSTGIYYIKLLINNEKYPASGLTKLVINDYLADETKYSTAPTLKGAPGTGIKSITGNGQSLEITLTNGRKDTIKLPTLQGPAGPKGDPGVNGDQGTGIQEITADGDTLHILLDNLTSYDVKIPTVKGDKGDTGATGNGIKSITQNGDTLTVTDTNDHAQTFTIPAVKGDKGDTGATGNGIKSITQDGDKLTVTDTNNQAQTFTIPTIQGNPGATGNGIKSITQEGATLDILYTNGQADTFTVPTIQGKTGATGQDGQPGPRGIGIKDIRQGATTVQANDIITTLIVTLTDNTQQSVQITIPEGPQGPQGKQGPTGRGITSITPGQDTGSLTVNYSDNTTDTVTVPTVKGDQGPAGKDGADGKPGEDGKDGNGIKNITQDGNRISIVTDNASYTITVPTVKGEQGPAGPTGPAGNGIKDVTHDDKGLITFTLTDGSTYNVQVPTVTQSPDGSATKNIYITDITSAGNEITVHLNDGDTKTFTIPRLKGDTGANGKPGADGKPGKDGADGQPGKDGVSIQSVTQDGDKLTLTLSNGVINTFTIPTVKGDPGQPGAGIDSIKQDGATLTIKLTNGDTKTLTVPTVKGPAGHDGNGIATITTEGDTITFNMTDGDAKTFTVPTVQGVKGNDGPAGRGIKELGSQYSSYTKPNGDTVYTFNVVYTDDTSSNLTLNIPSGQQGPAGPAGKPGDQGPAGPAGEPGANGKDGEGITSVTKDGASLVFNNSKGVVSRVTLPELQNKSVTGLDYKSPNLVVDYSNNTERLVKIPAFRSIEAFPELRVDNLSQVHEIVVEAGDNTYIASIATQSNADNNLFRYLNNDIYFTTKGANTIYLPKVREIVNYKIADNNNSYSILCISYDSRIYQPIQSKVTIGNISSLLFSYYNADILPVSPSTNQISGPDDGFVTLFTSSDSDALKTTFTNDMADNADAFNNLNCGFSGWLWLYDAKSSIYNRLTSKNNLANYNDVFYKKIDYKDFTNIKGKKASRSVFTVKNNRSIYIKAGLTSLDFDRYYWMTD